MPLRVQGVCDVALLCLPEGSAQHPGHPSGPGSLMTQGLGSPGQVSGVGMLLQALEHPRPFLLPP
jgi:hypothetical protein